MPIYEYYCQQCNADVELLVRNSDEKPHCPNCNSKRLEKLLSVTAAPNISSGSLPVCSSQPAPNCGRPQCGSECMFGD